MQHKRHFHHRRCTYRMTGSDRWREAMHFKTSRETDRGADQEDDDEIGVTVFENRRALPRAWIVGTVVPLDGRPATDAVQTSKLPDGSAFDPHVAAIVDRERVRRA